MDHDTQSTVGRFPEIVADSETLLPNVLQTNAFFAAAVAATFFFQGKPEIAGIFAAVEIWFLNALYKSLKSGRQVVKFMASHTQGLKAFAEASTIVSSFNQIKFPNTFPGSDAITENQRLTNAQSIRQMILTLIPITVALIPTILQQSSVKEFVESQKLLQDLVDSVSPYLINLAIPMATFLALSLEQLNAQFWSNFDDYSDNAVDVQKLKALLARLKKQSISIISPSVLQRHVAQSIGHKEDQRVLSIIQRKRGLFIAAPFSVTAPNHAVVESQQPLIAKEGIVIVSGHEGLGKSLLLKILTHQVAGQESAESYIKIGNRYVPVHNLRPEQFPQLFRYLSAANLVCDLPPYILFGPGHVFPTLPDHMREKIGSDAERIIKHHQTGQASWSEELAMRIALDYAQGKITNVAWVMHEYGKMFFRMVDGLTRYPFIADHRALKDNLAERLRGEEASSKRKKRLLFSPLEIEQITETASFSHLPTALRLKLAMMDLVDNPIGKIIAVDELLDTLTLKELRVITGLLAKSATTHHQSFFIASNSSRVQAVLRNNPMYRSTITLQKSDGKTLVEQTFK